MVKVRLLIEHQRISQTFIYNYAYKMQDSAIKKDFVSSVHSGKYRNFIRCLKLYE